MVKWSETSLVLRIFIGLVIGTVLGLTVPQLSYISILGLLFVSGLKAIAPILVAVLVAASIAKAGGGLGPRFRTVISRYLLSTFIAAICAVTGSFLFPVTLELSDVVDQAAPGALSDVFTNLLTNIVTNPMMSLTQANYIGILFWAILIGIALKLKASKQTIDVVHDFSEVITLMTMAVAHTVGVEVSFMSALFLGLIATLGACGTSGVAGGSLLLIPMACSFFNIGNDVAMQAVAVGFIIGVIQDSVETALNSSGDVFFTATAEYYERMKQGKMT